MGVFPKSGGEGGGERRERVEKGRDMRSRRL